MSISHIETTKFFDEVRAHFGRQTQAGKPVELILKAGIKPDGIAFIAYTDGNNSKAKPFVLMINKTATGVNWENQIGSGAVFKVVNQALLAFSDKKKVWTTNNHDFTFDDAVNFLINFMKQVSSYLR